MSAGVPRLFLDHFHSTSLVAEMDDRPVGFLIGFMSPSVPTAAYIHFVGVDPQHRREAIGRQLYLAFFDLATSEGRREVCAITSAVNHGSISFHARMGFDVSEPIPDYDGPGTLHVAFSRRL